MDWSVAKYGVMISGVDLKHPESILSRTALVSRIQQQYESGERHFLFYAPPATGKTALAQLFVSSLNNVQIVYISCVDFESENPFQVLADKGIDLKNHSVQFNSSTLFVLDDCHTWFGYDSFWNSILKTTALWCSNQIRFLYIATSLLNKPKPPPLYFKSLPKLFRKDFLLSMEECLVFSNIIGAVTIGSTFSRVLIEECSGIIGLMALSVAFLRVDFRFKKGKTESDYLRHFYSQKFTPYLARCFSFDIDRPDLSISSITALSRMLVRSEMIKIDEPDVLQNEGFSNLEDSGIILKIDGFFSFSSPFAKRYLFNIIFPSRSETNPSSIIDLVVRAISRMSASLLSRSIVPDRDDFPKDAVFQQLFISGLAAETPPNVCICPELGRRFPSDSDSKSSSIAGEIDFYVDGDIRWGIELLVGEDKISEHLARCGPSGKYAALNMLDYVVVDFRRGGQSAISKLMLDEKRMTVVFPPDDFSSCTVVVGMIADVEGKRAKEVLSISLQP